MMHDPKLIEAMARAICCPNNPVCRCKNTWEGFTTDAAAALTAICAARPDVAAVLVGEAVALPKSPSDSQWTHIAAALDAHPASLLMERQRRWWPDLVAANPYPREPGA